jgi:hypothetical protein
VDRLERDPARDHLELGHRLAANVCGDAAQNFEHPCASGIDDSGLLENVELVLRGGERRLAARDEVGKSVLERRVGGRELLGPLGERAGNGEHRPLLRVPHGGVARVAGSSQRPREACRIDPLSPAELLGGAADELREDDARVAARSHENGTDDVGLGIPFQRRHRGADGLRHVRPRIPVRDRVDVQVVDPGPARLQRREGSAQDG